MTIKIEFPADNKRAAEILGRALLELAGVPAATPSKRNAEAEASEFDAAATKGLDADFQGSGTTVAQGESSAGQGSEIAGAFSSSTNSGEVDPNAGAGSAAGSTADSSTNANTRVDEHGVPFDATYCAEAAEPFYKSGPNKGKWKKGRGVDEAAYNQWHAANKPALNDGTGATTDTADTSGAFGGGETQQAGPTKTPDLMAWVSEKQAGGHLTQEQVEQAYANVGITVMDLFAPDADLVAQRVSAVYTLLSAQAGA